MEILRHPGSTIPPSSSQKSDGVSDPAAASPNVEGVQTKSAKDAFMTGKVVEKQAAVIDSAGGAPALARPQPGALQMSAAQMKNLEAVLDRTTALLPLMPGLLEAEGKAAAEVADEPAGKRAEEDFSGAFDITKMSSLHSADLLMMVSFLLRVLGIANTAFEGKLMIIASDAADLSAKSIKDKGFQQMSTSIAQGSALFATAATGAGLKMVGFKKMSNDAATNGKAMNGADMLGKDAGGALSAAKGPIKATEAANIKLTPKTGGADESVDLTPSGKTLGNADRAVIAGAVKPASAEAAEASRKNQASAQKFTLTGDAVIGLGTSLGAMINGGGQLMTSKEEALQRIIDVLARASNQTSDNSRDQARAAISMIVEMLHAMLEALKSRAATVGAVAGNLRG